MRLVDRILERLKGVRQRRGYHMALCPAHDDREPSLSVSEADDRRALLHCHAGFECFEENKAAGGSAVKETLAPIAGFEIRRR